MSVLKKEIKDVSGKVVERLIHRGLIVPVQPLKSTRLLLKKHAIMTQVLILLIAPDAILIHQRLISTVQCVHILVVVVGDLVVVGHDLVPGGEVVLL